ncbi:MAG: tetratricopeptide repeat-containing sensor histidine kinase [Bacteroidales bacterium]|nr:tetratricopeptide repeat-containing sensor histidine kinase [Bacteroidales bacterium]
MNTKTNRRNARYTALMAKTIQRVSDVQIVAKVAVLLMFLATFQVLAQDNVMERLLQIEQEVASGNFSDEEMFTKYHQLTTHYATRDFNKTKLYFQKGIEFAREKKREEWEAQLWGKMGFNYREMGARDTFLIYVNKAIEIVEGKEHYLFESQIHRSLGSYYDDMNQNEKALSEYFKSLELIEKDRKIKLSLNEDVADNNIRQAETFVGIAAVYNNMRNLEKGVEYMLLAKQIYEEIQSEKALFDLSFVYANLAQYYSELGQTDKVFPYLLQAYELAMQHQYSQLVVLVLRQMSEYYRAEKDLPKALQYAKEALQIAEQTQYPTLLNWADIAMMETSIELKDSQTALFHASRIAERTSDDDWDNLKNLYNGLILTYSLMGNQAKVAENLKKLNDLTTKMSDKNMHDALQEMEVKYEVAQNELRHKEEIERQRVIRNYIFIGLAGALLVVALLVVIIVQRNKRNRALVETNTLKDKFFSIISHDLKNPAKAQRDNLELLVLYADKLDAQKVSDKHRELLKSANGLLDLLENLLNWAKTQTGRDTSQYAKFNLVAAFQSEINVVKNMAERKNITFEALTPATAFITADENMLKTVVRNLLANAVRFTEENGKVSLEITQRSGKLTVTVCDTGKGMTKEQQQNLFRIDRQQSTQDTAGEQGTGLGLIICKEFLKKHGTELHVESEEGKGSKFWFEVKI